MKTSYPKSQIAAQTRQMAIVAILFASSAMASGEERLTEATVIQLARTHSPASIIAGAKEGLAEARTANAGPMRNPTVSWNREAVGSGPGSAEDIMSASLPIDIARPLAARALAGTRGAWMRAQAALARNQTVLAAVLAYYDVVLSAQRITVLTQALANLDEATRVLHRREAAGSASGYESTRLAIASELRRSQLAEARGQQRVLQVKLTALIGAHAQTPPDGLQLLAQQTEAVTQSGQPRESVRQAHASERLAAQAQSRAAWGWLPVVTVGAGVIRTNDVVDAYGYVLGLSLRLPLFDHGQVMKAEAEAARILASARSQALSTNIAAQKRSALVSYQTARQELERFESQTSDQIAVLLAAAQSGYREGERSIVELLDAQRAQTDVLQRRLYLLGMAKRAEARLRSAAGVLQ